MGQRIALALIGIFLISLAPAADFPAGQMEDSIEPLDGVVKRIGIAADPNSIQDLGSPTVVEGFERIRDNTADSSIGVYTEIGLIPSVQLPNTLSQPRPDLASPKGRQCPMHSCAGLWCEGPSDV